ncbi:MAG: hypothetical protein Q8P53_01560 [Candidatus Shapirobacteria bacterium]|nr:hypothetical protein [Candidatus Shapirobacteria bacterium]
MIQLISKLIHPNSVIYIFYLSFFFTLIELFLIKTASWHKKYKTVIITCLFLLFFVYFRFSFSLFLIFIFYTLNFISYKIFPDFKSKLLLSFGLFILLIEVYIVAGLILNPKLSLIFICSVLFISIFYKFKLNKKIPTQIHKNLIQFIIKLNIIDLFIINLSFIISSQPQYHWDAVMANLYNAKWYILNNSFAPILESISSLFPQNGIGFFSFFYQIGGLRGFQFSFVFPLILLIYFLKEIFKKFNLSTSLQVLSYTILLTPIVIFQSSNGYYDLLLLVICLISIYFCYLYLEKPNIYLVYFSSFLFGFASGMKYFPLVFFFLPLIIVCLSKVHLTLKNFALISFIFLFPLTIWLFRTYSFTGSPVFPFAQYLFPTPKIWAPNDILENNFMIQTTLNKYQWITGGFVTYPLLTFIKSSSFLEATPGYTTLAYILFAIIFLVILVKLAIQIVKRQKFEQIQIIFLYSFIAYFAVGIVTRYYRYVWPYQFILALVTVIYISKLNLSRFQKYIIPLSTIIIIFNIFNTYKYFRAFPLYTKQFFQPEYYNQPNADNGPIVFINKSTQNNVHKKVLDASKHILPRVNFSAQTHQCNWYWIGWQNFFKTNSNYYSDTLSSFDYIITNNPIELSNNYCQDFVLTKLKNIKPVYQDQNYLIYENKK